MDEIYELMLLYLEGEDLNFTKFTKEDIATAWTYGKIRAGISSYSSIKINNALLPKLSKGIVYPRILIEVDLKYCSTCKSIKDTVEFYNCKSTKDGLARICKNCTLHKSKLQKLKKIHRTPKWANLEEIRDIYARCPNGYHVDHIIPLNGQLVSGLHVETNLQYLTAQENSIKHNKYEVK